MGVGKHHLKRCFVVMLTFLLSAGASSILDFGVLTAGLA